MTIQRRDRRTDLRKDALDVDELFSNPTLDADGKIIVGTASSLNDLIDTTASTLTANDFVKYDGTDWVNTTVASTDLTDESTLARLASPAFTGAPTSPTPTAGDDSTKIATTEFVQDAVTASNLPTLNTDQIFVGNATNQTVATDLSSVNLSSLNNDLGLATVATSGSYSDLSNTPSSATETTEGLIRIATSAEATTGTDDTIAMTPLTTQERISAALVGGVKYKTTFNATAGTPSLANAAKGDLYIIDTAGTIYGQDWNVGDHLLINENMGGSVTNSKIDKVDNTDAVASVNSQTGVINLTATDVGALASGDNISELTNDSGYITSAPVSSVNTQTGAVVLTAANVGALASGDNVSELVNDAGYISSVSSANETTAGIIETATNTEAATGTATDKALVPSNVSSLSIASTQVTGLGTAASSDTGDFLAAAAGLDDLSDVSFTAGAGIDNYVLTYDHSTASWVAEPASSGDSPNLKVIVGNYTLSAADAPNIYIWNGTNTSGTSTITMPLVSDVISSIATNTGGPVETFEVRIGRAYTGDIQINASGTDELELLNGLRNYTTTVTLNSGEWITLVGYLSSSKGNYLINSSVSASTDLSDSADLARLASPVFTGTPAAPTAASGTNTTQIATTAFVQSAVSGSSGGISSLVEDGAPQLGGDLNPSSFGISGHLLPSAANTYNLGSADAEWSNLYLGENSKILFGNDQDVELIHDPDDGLVLDLGVADAQNDPQFELKGQGTGHFGPRLTFNQESTSPAQHNRVGQIRFRGNDSAGNGQDYGFIYGQVWDPTSGAEAGKISIVAYPSSANTRGLHVEGVAGDPTKAKVNIDHNGSTYGLHLNNTLVTSTAAELNLLDGATSVGSSITLADTDGIVVNDAGTSKLVPVSDVKDYIEANASFLSTTSNLTDLNNVTVSTPSNGQVISYNSTSGEWENSTPASGGATNLDGLSDVTITTPSSAQVLRHNGAGQFVNTDLTIVDDTTPQLGGHLNVNGNSITSASNGNITLDPNGTGDIVIGADLATSSNANLALAPNGTGYVEVKGNTNPGAIRLNCENNSHGVTIQSPAHSANATYTLTLPNDDGDADQVLKTDGSGNLDWVDQGGGGATTIGGLSDVTSASYVDGEILRYDSGTSAFVSTTQSKIKRVSSSTHTLTSAEVADGIYVIYTGTAVEFDLTLPDPNSLTENNSVDGSATKVVEVRVGRDIGGDIRIFGHATNTVYWLGDVATNAKSRRTVHSSHFITVLGFASSNTGYWITADGDKQIDDFVNISTGSNALLYGGEFVNLKTGISSGFTCTIRGSGREARKIVVNNDSNITVSIIGYIGTPTSINGTSPGSFSLEAGKRIELYCDTDANPDDWITVNPQQGVATQLSDLSDVDITGATTGEVLRYDGSNFVDAQLNYSDLSGTPTLGTAAALAVGTSANQVVQLDGSAKLPAVDGSQLTNLPSGGGFNISNINSNTTAQPNYHYSCNTSNNAITLTLPAITSSIKGKEIRVKLLQKGTNNNLSIAPDSNGDTIEGNASYYVLSVDFSSITLVANNGTNDWEIV